MTTPPPSTKTLGIKGPLVAIPFLIAVACTIAAAAWHKISAETAAMILVALGFPSAIGVKTVPQLMSALVAELQRQLASMPPPPITSVAPPPAPLQPLTSIVPPAALTPTGTEHPTDLVTIPPEGRQP